jgi:hypothetical protein
VPIVAVIATDQTSGTSTARKSFRNKLEDIVAPALSAPD